MISREFRSEKILWFAIASYVIVMGVLVVLRHYQFQTQAWDLGLYTQTLWNTLQGRIMQNSIEEIPQNLAVHMNPVMFLLVPLYALFPTPYALLILQTLIIALGSWPLYLLSRYILQEKFLSLVIAISYLLYPGTQWVNWFDFHPIAFLPTFFFAGVYCALQNRWRWAILFLALAASTKEDAILLVAVAGLWFALSQWRWRTGISIFSVSIVYFLISVLIIMPWLGGGLLRVDRYANLGNSPAEIAQTFLFHPLRVLETITETQKLLYVFWLLAPLLFLPLLGKWAILLFIPGVLENILTYYPAQFSGEAQYDAMVIPGIFLATIYGTRTLVKRFPLRYTTIGYAILCAGIVSFLVRAPLSPKFLSYNAELFKSNIHQKAYLAMIRKVPPNVSVTAHTNLVPHLANREYVYMLGYEPFMPDYVLADGADYFGFGSPEAFQNHIQRYADSGQYTAEILDERYYILKKITAPAVR